MMKGPKFIDRDLLPFYKYGNKFKMILKAEMWLSYAPLYYLKSGHWTFKDEILHQWPTSTVM